MNANYDKNLFLYLSSVGQSNHADFQVNMSDPLTLPPHSQVRLVNARVNATNNIVEVDGNNNVFSMFIGCGWSRTAGSYAPFFVELPRGRYDLKNNGDPEVNFSAMLQKALNDAMTNFPRARGGWSVSLNSGTGVLTMKLQSMEAYIVPTAVIPAEHRQTWTTGRNSFDDVLCLDAIGNQPIRVGGLPASVSPTIFPDLNVYGINIRTRNSNNTYNSWISPRLSTGEIGGTANAHKLVAQYYADFNDITDSQGKDIPDDNFFLWWFGTEQNEARNPPLTANPYRPSAINIVKRFDNIGTPLVNRFGRDLSDAGGGNSDRSGVNSDMFVVGAAIAANGEILISFTCQAQQSTAIDANGNSQWRGNNNMGQGMAVQTSGNKIKLAENSEMLIQFFEMGKSNVNAAGNSGGDGGDLVQYGMKILKKAPTDAAFSNIMENAQQQGQINNTANGGGANDNFLQANLRTYATAFYGDTKDENRFQVAPRGTPHGLMTCFSSHLNLDGNEDANHHNWSNGGHRVAFAYDPVNEAQGGFIAKGGGTFTTGEERDAIANNVSINHSITIMNRNLNRFPSQQGALMATQNKIDSTANPQVAFANSTDWRLPYWDTTYSDKWGNVDCKILGLSARGWDGQADVAASWTTGVVGGDADGVVKQTGEFPQYYMSLPDLPQLQNFTASKTGFNSKNAFLAPIDLSQVNNTSVGDETYTSERKTELYNDLGNSMPITLNTLRVRICDIDGVPTEDLDAYTIACLEVRPDPVIKQAKMMAKYMRQGDNLTDRQIYPYGNQVQ